MIVVVDSGIWVSAFHFGGTPQAVVDELTAKHTVAICDDIIAEVRAVLVRKFRWEDSEVLEVFAEYLHGSIQVDVTGVVAGVCRDPKDDMILECALKAEATLIVSGDLDLLSLKTYQGIFIVTARDCMGRMLG